ncbi:MAG: energy transducer TonB [Gemmatimonadaceae bacterium]
MKVERAALCAIALSIAVGCGKQDSGAAGAAMVADSLPVFIGDSLPFRYPPAMYIQRVQDDVTLRLYLDEYGRPVPESTKIEAHALNAVFDSSALQGASDLVFRPAIRDGKPMPYPVLFPIKFRVPDGPPMPGDSAAPSR